MRRRACCCLSILMLFLSACRARRDIPVIHVDDRPADGVFRLKVTAVNAACADFESAVYRDTLGYPHVDFTKFDRDHPGTVVKTFEAVILENKYIALILIPGRGKPYSFVYKISGHEEFFIPAVAQALGSPNRLGWWFALGGVEYTMPTEEHGDTWASEWDWTVIEDSRRRKAVQMQVAERRFGLRETIIISIVPDRAFFEAAIRITNPTNHTVVFQHWINPMWAPGGRGEITLHTEFIMPTERVFVTERLFNSWMLAYHPERNRLQDYERSPLRFLSGWKSIGDLLAWKLESGFYGAFCHEENEGIVRVFPLESQPGCNIWAWGRDPDIGTRRRFSGTDTCLGYVEMWGGLTHGFDAYMRLEPGESLSWKEWMYPFTGTRGLHFANRDIALTFTKDAHRVFIRVCPSGDVKDIECRIVNSFTDHILARVVFNSCIPKKEPEEFSFAFTDDIELVVLDGRETIARLQPREIPDASIHR